MLVDAAVHASGAFKKLTSPFVPAMAANRKNAIDRADKNTTSGKNKQRKYTGKYFSFQESNCIAEALPLSNSLCWLVAQAVVPCRSSV